MKIPKKYFDFNNPLVFGTALILIIILLTLAAQSRNTSPTNTQLDDFAACTKTQGLVMFGTDWCPYCNQQRDLLGNSFEYINYVNCDNEAQRCYSEGITGYPTWDYRGQKYVGVQSLDTLQKITGCEL